MSMDRHRSGLFAGWRARQWIGAVLFALGALITVILAYVGNSKSPPSAQTQAITAGLGLLAQAGSVWMFSGVGRAETGLAARAVGRLYTNAMRANEAKLLVQHLFENDPPVSQIRRRLGGLSVTLSVLEEGFLESMEDWRTFHPDVVQSVEGRRAGGEQDPGSD